MSKQTIVAATAPVRLTVFAKPRAKRSRLVHVDGLKVEVAVAAPPVEGAANEELLAILAAALSLPKRSLRLALGSSSKRKVIEVSGLAEHDVIHRLIDAASTQR